MNFDRSIRAEISRAVELGRTPPNGQIGLSEDRIDEVENDFGVELPGAYRSFLRNCGAGLGGVGIGSTIFYPEILGIRSAVIEMLAENGVASLGNDDIPFYLHQGYYAAWLNGKSSDPQVVSYLEGWSEPRLAAPGFVAWLHDFVTSG